MLYINTINAVCSLECVGTGITLIKDHYLFRESGNLYDKCGASLVEIEYNVETKKVRCRFAGWFYGPVDIVLASSKSILFARTNFKEGNIIFGMPQWLSVTFILVPDESKPIQSFFFNNS